VTSGDHCDAYANSHIWLFWKLGSCGLKGTPFPGRKRRVRGALSLGIAPLCPFLMERHSGIGSETWEKIVLRRARVVRTLPTHPSWHLNGQRIVKNLCEPDGDFPLTLVEFGSGSM